MEDTLRGIMNTKYKVRKDVLILVLMEDTLRVSQVTSKKQKNMS